MSAPYGLRGVKLRAMDLPGLFLGALLASAVPAIGRASWRRYRSWRKKVETARLGAAVAAGLLLPRQQIQGDVPQVSVVNDGPGVARDVRVDVVRAVSPGATPTIAPKTRYAMEPGQFDWWPMPWEDGMAKVVEVRVRWIDGFGPQELTRTLDGHEW